MNQSHLQKFLRRWGDQDFLWWHCLPYLQICFQHHHLCQYKVSLSLFVESNTHMTHTDFTIFLKIGWDLKCLFQQNNLINTLIWQIFWKMSSPKLFQKIREIYVCHMYRVSHRYVDNFGLNFENWKITHGKK